MKSPYEYLFAYGTLRRNRNDQSPHPLLKGCLFVSYATMAGQMYEVDGYPAVISNQTGQVHGELYWLPNPHQTLLALDVYEECAAHFPLPHEYRRSQRAIMLDQQSTTDAWVYLYNWPVANLRIIPSGDYFNEAQTGRQ